MKELLSVALNRVVNSVNVIPLSGGDINRSYRLDTDGKHYFVKTNSIDNFKMFEAEAKSLEVLRQTGAIRVPEVVSFGAHADVSYLLLEYISSRTSANLNLLAQHLARLHKNQSLQFGFEINNWIGLTPQTNLFEDSWIEFWKKNRLQVQLLLCQKNNFKADLVDCGYRLAEKSSCFFESYQPAPSLLHGDLWSGNWQFDGQGNPVIYDPACYYGDHEVDLAMLELFGNPGLRFYAEYNEHFPIDTGYAIRRELYNLYHLLNHANMFGGSYSDQARQSIKMLLAQC